MASTQEQMTLDYLFSSNNAEVVRRNGRNTNFVKIGGVSYRYNRNLPITSRLKTKLNKVRKTMDFKKYELEKTKNVKWTKLDKNKPLQRDRQRGRSNLEIGNVQASAFGGYVNSYTITNIQHQGLKGLQYLKDQEPRLRQYLQKHNGMKVKVQAKSEFISKKTREVITHTVMSRRYDLTNVEDIPKTISQIATDIEIQMDRMELSESGLVIKQIKKLIINYDKYNPTRGGSFIDLPKWVSDKKACINILNTDQLCLKYAVQCGVCKVYDKVHPERMYHYRKIEDDGLNWDNVNFPSSMMDIDNLEENNQGLLSVNVYFLKEEGENKSILLYRASKVPKATHHVNVLKLDKGDQSHYVFIKNYDRMMSSQTNKSCNTKYHCHSCMKGFKMKETLDKHVELGCLAVEGQQVEMPDKEEVMKFKNHYKKLKAPFVIYADFECLTVPKEVNPDDNTQRYQHHRPCGFMINVVSAIDNSSYQFLHRGEDCMEVFTDKMIKVKDEIMGKMRDEKDIIMTEQDQRDFNNATHCFICGECFKPGDKKVRDHCHFTGKYRGCAHDDCNLQFAMRYYKIPVFLHNLKNYDAHLIIEKAVELSEKARIDAIAQNTEKFITFAFKNMAFKDSFSFLSSSLDKLVKLTKYEDGKKRRDWDRRFKYSNRNKFVSSKEDLDLLTEKGVYPYDYFDSFDRFRERELPPKEAFYSKLSEGDISDEDYERAQKIWRHFGIRSLGMYHDLYLRTDVLLLTDVFENFRDLCLEYYGLDPAHYLTLPNFAWDAMLLKTNHIIYPITDQEMYEFVESHKEAIANNKYMGEQHDETKPSSYITYLDANSLYGLAMTQKLPMGELKWCKKMLTEDRIKEWDDDDNFGYILDVDLEYPVELHDEHLDYPLAPENVFVRENMLSEYQRGLYRHFYNDKDPKDEKTPKLILNLNDKENYVVHIRTLKFYLNKGMKLKKVHRMVKFQQRCWLKPWVDFNTQKRKEAKSDFEKDLFKLMSNAVYGKTMENVRNHIEFELVKTPERMQKCINNPNYQGSHIINESLTGVQKTKTVLKLNKPIYIGQAILDISKHHMYSFFYEVAKKRYGKDVKLLYTDTDSHVMHIHTEDVYKDWDSNPKFKMEHMDFSDYPKDHFLYDATNKKVLGKFKDEMNGKIITKFIALRPKMYSLNVYEQTSKEEQKNKKAKGVPRKKVEKELTMKDYEEALHEQTSKNVKFNAIRSKNHQIYSITQTKVGLTSYDNKRYWTNDIDSVPYGYYSLRK